MEHQSPKGDCREEDEEGSEDKHTILIDGGCANQRASVDGSLNYEGVPTNGCSKLYIGDIEIRFENVATRQSSHKHEDEELVADNEEPRSTSPSPLELQEVDQIKNKEEEEFTPMNHPSLKGILR